MAQQLLMGNEAFAHAALEAGVGVVAGYPGTPSTELIETVAKRVQAGAAEGVHVEWSTNEKAALELVTGASYAGARTMFTCKQVGLNVASDPLMSLNYVGVEGGCVIYVADDPGPISSQTEQDTRRFASFAKIPVFDPANIEQGMEMIPAAFDLSERYRAPVIVRSTTRVCHSSTFVDVAESTQAKASAGFTKDDSRWVIFPARSYRGHLEINERLANIAHEFSGCTVEATPAGLPSEDLARFNPITDHDTAPKLGILCGGVSAAYAEEALAQMAARAAEDPAAPQLPAYRFMQVGTPYPFPEERVGEFVDGLDTVIVFEELDSVLEDALVQLMGKRAAAGKAVVRVLGRAEGTCRAAGENSVDDCIERLSRFFDAARLAAVGLAGEALDRELEARALARTEAREAAARHLDVELPARPPVLCAGCPHRGAFYACKTALKKMGTRAVFSGDIGCYTLGNAKPLDAVDTCLCMGAGITMAQGLSVADPTAKQIAFIGDSTFFASGMTGVANAVYNQHDITICVLDNRITAMTGGQPHPGTGTMLMGPQSDPLCIEDVLRALKVECIEFANPHRLEESIGAVTRAVSFEGPSAVIFRAPCVNLFKHGAPVAVDAEACRGCKRCITTIGCPAISFADGVAAIDTALCTGCGLCTQLCPFGAISKEAE